MLLNNKPLQFSKIHSYELMLQCWQMNPSNRPQFSDIVKELDGVLHGEDQQAEHADPATDNTKTVGGYEHLSQPVDYSTDREGYDHLHKADGYMDMSGQVDYVQAAEELGVPLERTSSRYLAPIEQQPPNDSGNHKPVPAPRTKKGTSPFPPRYQNVADLRIQLQDEESSAEKAEENTDATKMEDIALVEVAAPATKQANSGRHYENVLDTQTTDMV